MNIILDTHAALFYAAGEGLGPNARSLLADTERRDLIISDVSLTEIARLITRKRIFPPEDPVSWMENFTKSFTVVPVTAHTALLAANYSFAHKDPADRQILATAQALGIPLVTKDRELARLAPTIGVRTVW